jgi:6,7-dimethyl-8-ribityllumazine synthase
MTEYAGGHAATGRRFCLVVSRYNRVITDRLAEGAKETFVRHGAREADVDTVRVPGAWEIPAAVRVAAAGGYDAIVALGCVVRGQTPHFDFICQATTYGLARLVVTEDTPITFGVITADTLEQARERVGGKHGHKGQEAALAALEMCDVFEQLSRVAP